MLSLGWVAPICLPYFNDPELYQGISETIGWGLVVPMVSSYSAVIQTLKVPIISEEACHEKEYKSLAAGTFCAGGVLGQDSCNGDSGGPLLKVNEHLEKCVTAINYAVILQTILLVFNFILTIHIGHSLVFMLHFNIVLMFIFSLHKLKIIYLFYVILLIYCILIFIIVYFIRFIVGIESKFNRYLIYNIW